MTFDQDSPCDADYLETALRIHQDHPELGAFGSGTSVAIYDREPPSWFAQVSNLLVLREISQKQISNSMTGGPRPWGMGLCVTRDVAEAYLAWCTNIVERGLYPGGRKATGLEDDLFSICAVELGLMFGIFPELRILHILPASRLQLPYPVSLAHSHGYSTAHMAMLTKQSLLNPAAPASLKAALMLLILAKPKLSWYEFRRWMRQSREGSELSAIRAARHQGWKMAMNDFQGIS